ncbi:MAG TPA: IclR family transcriptional regulator [Chloroflexi bacterium]|nr:IclR family transcriptional regulator [Chloroflexota bacterium]
MPSQRSRGGRGIASVYRALSILELFDAHTAELGITEMAERLALHKSTLAGLVYTLESSGYLEQNPTTRKYRLGVKLVERAFVALGHLEVTRVALPHLERLRNWRDETVNLAVLDGDEVVYIERLLSSQTLGMRSEVGKRAMVHSTALGKALLSQLPRSEVDAFLANCDLAPVTPNTITEPQELKHELDLVRSRGYALDMEEDQIGGACIAAPIFDHKGKAIAAVSISVPIARLRPSEISHFGAKVIGTARAISEDLGYAPQDAAKVTQGASR